MSGWDIGAIISGSIGFVSLIINVIYNTIKRKQEQEKNNDREQWELIKSMVAFEHKKLEQICKTLNRLIKKLKKGDII